MTKRQKERQKEKKAAARRQLPKHTLHMLWEEHADDITGTAAQRIDNYLSHNVGVRDILGDSDEIPASPSGRDRWAHRKYKSLVSEDIEAFCRGFERRFDERMQRNIFGRYGLYSLIVNILAKTPEMKDYFRRIDSRHSCTKAMRNYLFTSGIKTEATRRIVAQMTPERLADGFCANRKYRELALAAKERIFARRRMSELFMQKTPENYAEFFPLAREKKRHFVLHIGPTNSGKTYQAVEELMRAEYGIYLAPLRLLAFEQYEKMTKRGVACAMITGEERIVPANPTHQSSTIEMAALEKPWDVAVIDEAQMIGDEARGSAWTNAILGICADVVHVCASENALDCLLKMIESCGDTVELEYCSRKTPLVFEEDDYLFPDDVSEGDALIVFSRRDVHGVAADLTEKGIACSIIYGALPYDVRHSEAAKFASGETKVVVSTDAIGMGMNLPVKRIVFLEADKYDGRSRRLLKSTEVKQIAGRAGRFGIYESGYVNSITEKSHIRMMLDKKDEVIEKAVIGIPEIFFDNDEAISDVLAAWDDVPATKDYDKGDIEEKIAISRDLEAIGNDRELIRRFISFAVDRSDRYAYPVLVHYYKIMYRGEIPDIKESVQMYSPEGMEAEEKNMQRLEGMYRVHDFLYAYASTYSDDETVLSEIISTKRQISDKLNEILAKTGFAKKTCRRCGRSLHWNYPYGLCDKCFRSQRFER